MLAAIRKTRCSDMEGRDGHSWSKLYPQSPPRCRSRLATASEIVCNASMEGKQYQVTVRARSTYVPEQSDEDGGRFVFAYTITITNTGTVAAKLISRHWVITDSDNRVQEVRGMGVVGEQPTLKPQE